MSIIASRFFMKCNLLIPDNLAFIGDYNGRKFCVAVNKRSVVMKQSFSKNADDWASSKDTLRSELLLFNENGDKRISQEIYINPQDVFSYGYIEHDTYNLLMVMFNDENNSFIEESRHKECVDISKNILNYFIEMYRFSSQIGSIPSSDNLISPLVELTICEGKTLEQYDNDCTFTQFSYTITETMRHGFFENTNVGTDILDKFSINLLTNKQIEIYEKFIIDAREQAFVKRDYCMSIVLIETAFEIFVKNKLQIFCHKNSITKLTSPFNKKMKMEYIKAISKSNIKGNIFDDYFINLLSFDVRKTPEFVEWDSKAYKIRNAIIHSGSSHYGFTEAEQAFKSTISFMNLISQKIQV